MDKFLINNIHNIEVNEIQNVNHFEEFEANKEVIAINRAKFEKLKRDEDDDEALERVAVEIQEQYELNRQDEVDLRNVIYDTLLNNQVANSNSCGSTYNSYYTI